VSVLILHNEPDFFEHGENIHPKGYNYLRAVLSAIDGVLAAEWEAGVPPGRVRMTAAFSFALREAVDGTQGSYVHHWGWKDLLSVVQDPSIVSYTTRTPQADLEMAFRARWMNCVNQAGPRYVQQALAEGYTETFGSMPFFIGEYGALWQTASNIEEDLREMDEMALDDSNPFAGAAVFQFQQAYRKGWGTEMNYGLFNLGAQIHQTGEVCDAPLHGSESNCHNFSVQCLNTTLNGFNLPAAATHRAQAVESAWGGSLVAPGICQASSTSPGTRRLRGVATPAVLV